MLAGLLPAPAAADAASPETYLHGAVASVDARASAAGVEILRRGGSAADAAVAVALALAVVHPQAGNLAGGHFTIWRAGNGEAEVIDARERAPAAARPDMFLDASGAPRPGASTDSALAIAVPGTLPGLELLHRRHGLLPWADLVEPALALARDGIEISPRLAADLALHRERLAADEPLAAILLPRGAALLAGDRLVQEDLAWALGQIRDTGAAAFASGPLHERLAADLARRGAALAGADLAAAHARSMPPLRGRYRDWTVLVPPPPSAGGLGLLQSLQALSGFEVAGMNPDSAVQARLLAEVLRRPFRDRQRWLADPDFFTVPVEDLLSSARMATWAAEISSGLADSPHAARAAREAETTHFSVIDSAGNAVAHTTTLNSTFGAAMMARGTGILWNNGMDDFSTAPGVPDQFGIPGSAINAIAPGKRPLSSMTPTVVEQSGRLVCVLGSPGGSTIPSTVLQVLVRLLDHRQAPATALAAPRLHHQDLPDVLQFEPGGWDAETLERLRGWGYDLQPGKSSQGDVHLLSVGAGGAVQAASDPRRGGAPAGY